MPGSRFIPRGVLSFFHWLEGKGIADCRAVRPIHVAAYIEELQKIYSKLTVKQYLAAIRRLFDWRIGWKPTTTAETVSYSLATDDFTGVEKLFEKLPPDDEFSDL